MARFTWQWISSLLVQLKQLGALVFSYLGLTSLQAIPSDFTHVKLEKLYVDRECINYTVLHQIPKLDTIRMDQNNIVDLSHLNVSQTQVEKMIRFTFAGNPVCSALR